MTITHALIARRGEDKTQTVAFEDIPLADLPAGEVLVRVSHSALNYKDALAITGRAGADTASISACLRISCRRSRRG